MVTAFKQYTTSVRVLLWLSMSIICRSCSNPLSIVSVMRGASLDGHLHLIICRQGTVHISLHGLRIWITCLRGALELETDPMPIPDTSRCHPTGSLVGAMWSTRVEDRSTVYSFNDIPSEGNTRTATALNLPLQKRCQLSTLSIIVAARHRLPAVAGDVAAFPCSPYDRGKTHSFVAGTAGRVSTRVTASSGVSTIGSLIG